MPPAKTPERSLHRKQLYTALAKAMRSIVKSFPEDAKVEMDSHVPFSQASLQDVPEDLVFRLEQVHAGLFALAASSPLEISEDVREIFRIEASGERQNIYLVVQNSIGKMEHVTTHPLHRDAVVYFDGWCACRELSETLDTSWDEARSERRVVIDGRYADVIDRGANRLIDIVLEAGGTTRFSCEGHPAGGYLVFGDNEAGTIEAAFVAVGWKMDENNLAERKVARMPEPKDVHERDANWRRTCAGLEEILGLVPANGNVP